MGLYGIGGWVMALIVEIVWYRQYKKMVAEWYERCEQINAHWHDLCMGLIDEGAEPKDEPQTDWKDQMWAEVVEQNGKEHDLSVALAKHLEKEGVTDEELERIIHDAEEEARKEIAKMKGADNE